MGSPNRDTPHRDQRRVGHIHAEQKRRYNIKNGFDMIHSLIPHLNQNPNAKVHYVKSSNVRTASRN
jgi:thymidylate synthase